MTENNPSGLLRFTRSSRSVKLAEMRYIQTLSIEYFEEWDANILFLPDEWGASTTDALNQAKALIAEKGLETVDFAIMHGMFDYQLDVDIPGIPRHSSDEWLALVEYLIFIGHVHLFSTYQRIIAQGSFDRLSQNEEGPKGFVRAVVEPDGSYTSEFIENVGAMKFVTIRPDDAPLADFIQKVRELAKSLPDWSYIRISAPTDHPIQQGLDVFKSEFPCLNWDMHVSVKAAKITDVLAEPPPSYTPIQIDRHTLLDVMAARLDAKKYPETIRKSSLAVLKEIREALH